MPNFVESGMGRMVPSSGCSLLQRRPDLTPEHGVFERGETSRLHQLHHLAETQKVNLKIDALKLVSQTTVASAVLVGMP